MVHFEGTCFTLLDKPYWLGPKTKSIDDILVWMNCLRCWCFLNKFITFNRAYLQSADPASIFFISCRINQVRIYSIIKNNSQLFSFKPPVILFTKKFNIGKECSALPKLKFLGSPCFFWSIATILYTLNLAIYLRFWTRYYTNILNTLARLECNKQTVWPVMKTEQVYTEEKYLE